MGALCALNKRAFVREVVLKRCLRRWDRDKKRPSMRWAARYQFLEELWRERKRLLIDPELDDGIRRQARRGEDDEPMVAELLASLLPLERGQASEAWVLRSTEVKRAVEGAYGGVSFVDMEEAEEVANDGAWEVACVHLELPSGEGEFASRCDPRRLALLERLCERVGEKRLVVLSLSGPRGEALDYESFAEFVEEFLPEAQIYGLSFNAMASIYCFADSEDEGEEGEVSIDYDNRLAAMEPRFDLFIASSDAKALPEGLSLMELPAGVESSDGEADHRSFEPATTERADRWTRSESEKDEEGLTGVRAQLAEARREVEAAALERQRLVEALNEAEDRVASLSEGMERASETRTSAAKMALQGELRADVWLAREQALRWEIERMEEELRLIRADSAGSEEVLPPEGSKAVPAPAPVCSAEAGAGTDMKSPVGETGPFPRRTLAEADRALQTLLRKLERGGMGVDELHRQLAAMREKLLRMAR